MFQVLDEHACRVINTILACQHPDGGFGGGPKQAAHLLPTYAAVSALAVVGRPGPGGGWDDIDRYVLPSSSYLHTHK
jgi:prenyltransferase beta subunit